jgi:hypothetical protein
MIRCPIWSGSPPTGSEFLVPIRLFVVVVAGLNLIGSASFADAQAMRVALSPIQVNSAQSETEYLSTGLADMIVARLEQTGQIAIRRLSDGVSDRESAIEAGKAESAEFVIYGSYTQFGDGASLDLNCVSVLETDEDAPRRVFIQAGSLGEIIPQLDDFSERISRHLVGAPVAAPAEEATSAQTPSGSSLPSLLDLQQRIEALESILQSAPIPSESAATE